MKAEYNFSNAVRNPYIKKEKKAVTIRLENDVIDYFKAPNPGDLGTTEAIITLRWPEKRRELTEKETNKKENKIATKVVFFKPLSP